MPLDLQDVLQRRFGFPAFRAGQRESIEEILSGGRLLCIQPTGHGKSLLYQLPTVLLSGITLVVSPLLALMRDQLGHLNQRFGIPAASINSDQEEAENQAARDAARAGRIRLLFLAPEQLDHVERFQFLLDLPVSLLVVDEAHCISTWGHDFRPSYRQIMVLAQALSARQPALRVLGLTATANARTEADIVAQLGGPERRVVVHRHGMDRPNLRLAVVPMSGMPRKLAYLGQQVSRLPGGGLLYCATRENTEIVAGYLLAQGIHAAAYHAGMEPERKRQLQEEFIAGRYQAIAATNALGMGIDKADLRYVIHVDLPGSLTAYYQEVGRAGRDGQPALGLLLYDPADQRIQDHFIRSAQPSKADFQRVLGAVADLTASGGPPGLLAVKSRSGLHPTLVTVILAELVEQGYLERRSRSGKQVYQGTGKGGLPDLGRYEVQNEVRTTELRRMRDYGRADLDCLMATLRRDLGDTAAPPCGRCSVCLGRSTSVVLGPAELSAAQGWLEARPVVIAATQRPKMAEGLALLSGELRTPAFLAFMKGRADAASGLDGQVIALLRSRLCRLGRPGARPGPRSVVVVPSRTWAQRGDAAALVAEVLGVPCLPDLLCWREAPAARQGELLNNDQRRDNVDGKMAPARGAARPPAGAILLFDDYLGSGATLREAVRVLRKELLVEEEIVPLTIARVRWRQGAAGMI